jgi:hypothetical protein
MTDIKITYKEPTDRPIERVEGGYTECTYARMNGDLFIHQQTDCIMIEAANALDWARAILKMVEQAQGGERCPN